MKVYQLIWTLLPVLFCLFNLSCNKDVKEIKIPLKNFKEATLNSGRFTEFSVLQTYPSMKSCRLDKSYSNLYICKEWSTDDTIYIFEECESVSNMALDSSKIYPLILSNKFVRKRKDTAIVFVPDNFKVIKNAKIVFAKTAFLTEY